MAAPRRLFYYERGVLNAFDDSTYYAVRYTEAYGKPVCPHKRLCAGDYGCADCRCSQQVCCRSI